MVPFSCLNVFPCFNRVNALFPQENDGIASVYPPLLIKKMEEKFSTNYKILDW